MGFSARADCVARFAAAALAPSFGYLLLSRALAGACGANIASAQAYVADITDDRSRAGAMGALGAALGLGFIFGPFAGGELARYGARVPFFAASALAAVNWLLDSSAPAIRLIRSGP